MSDIHFEMKHLKNHDKNYSQQCHCKEDTPVEGEIFYDKKLGYY